MGMSVAELEKMITDANAVNLISLNKKWYETDSYKDVREIDILEDKKGEDPTKRIQKTDLMRLVTKGLNRNERLIIILYYYEELTMKEIGATLDLSESRVSQMHSAIVQRLQGQLGSAGRSSARGRKLRVGWHAFADSTRLADSPRCGIGMLMLMNHAYAPSPESMPNFQAAPRWLLRSAQLLSLRITGHPSAGFMAFGVDRVLSLILAQQAAAAPPLGGARLVLGGVLRRHGVVLVLDMFVFHRHAHEPSLRESAMWTVFWCSLALAFNGLDLVLGGHEARASSSSPAI